MIRLTIEHDTLKQNKQEQQKLIGPARLLGIDKTVEEIIISKLINTLCEQDAYQQALEDSQCIDQLYKNGMCADINNLVAQSYKSCIYATHMRMHTMALDQELIATAITSNNKYLVIVLIVKKQYNKDMVFDNW